MNEAGKTKNTLADASPGLTRRQVWGGLAILAALDRKSVV